MLAALKTQYADQAVKFISLTVEANDDAAGVATWLERAKATSLETGRASMDNATRLYKMGGARDGVVPTTVFVSPDGNVSGAVTGKVSRDELDQAIRRILP